MKLHPHLLVGLTGRAQERMFDDNGGEWETWKKKHETEITAHMRLLDLFRRVSTYAMLSVSC